MVWHRFICLWNILLDFPSLKLFKICTVSLTPRRPSLRCHWHHGNHLQGDNDTAEIISAVSMTLQSSSLWGTHTIEISIISVVVVSTVSLTLRKFIVYKISQWIRSHMQNGINPLVRGLGGFDWWKNQGSKILFTLPLSRWN
jgi:hypothetical protein